MNIFIQFIICTLLFQVSIQQWTTGQATVYWDCSGMACDATRVPGDEWDGNYNPYYLAREVYAPVSVIPSQSVYGESLWGTFAASDKLSLSLGENSSHYAKESGQNGCGKCILVKNFNSLNPDFTAVLMKTNRCPPWATGCSNQDLPHIDIAVPGFDALAFSTANICGTKKINGYDVETCFENQQDSNQCLNEQFDPDNSCLCEINSKILSEGCKTFTQWGWNTGNPQVQYKVVDCPEELVQRIASADMEKFNTCSKNLNEKENEEENEENTDQDQDKNGENESDNEETENDSENEKEEQTGICYINECGCPGAFLQSWCNPNSSYLQANWCQQSRNNCENCSGVWCTEEEQKVANKKNENEQNEQQINQNKDEENQNEIEAEDGSGSGSGQDQDLDLNTEFEKENQEDYDGQENNNKDVDESDENSDSENELGEDIESSESGESSENSENPEDSENSENPENSEDLENSENSEDLENSENSENSEDEGVSVDEQQDGTCYINNCGCPEAFKQSWCHVNNSQMQADWCQLSSEKCEKCAGIWCVQKYTDENVDKEEIVEKEDSPKFFNEKIINEEDQFDDIDDDYSDTQDDENQSDSYIQEYQDNNQEEEEEQEDFDTNQIFREKIKDEKVLPSDLLENQDIFDKNEDDEEVIINKNQVGNGELSEEETDDEIFVRDSDDIDENLGETEKTLDQTAQNNFEENQQFVDESNFNEDLDEVIINEGKVGNGELSEEETENEEFVKDNDNLQFEKPNDQNDFEEKIISQTSNDKYENNDYLFDQEGNFDEDEVIINKNQVGNGELSEEETDNEIYLGNSENLEEENQILDSTANNNQEESEKLLDESNFNQEDDDQVVINQGQVGNGELSEEETENEDFQEDFDNLQFQKPQDVNDLEEKIISQTSNDIFENNNNNQLLPEEINANSDEDEVVVNEYEGGTCYSQECGCPNSFKQQNCDVENSQLKDDWCQLNEQKCEKCQGIWCTEEFSEEESDHEMLIGSYEDQDEKEDQFNNQMEEINENQIQDDENDLQQQNQSSDNENQNQNDENEENESEFACYNAQCGCPGEYKSEWCNDKNAFLSSIWCQEKEINCKHCLGVWC